MTLRPDPLPGHAHRVGQPAEKRRRATYADLEAVPPGKVAELIGGELYVFPRPAARHAKASSRLMMKLGGPFDLGEGGPGGWWILHQPEVHLADPAAAEGIGVVDPDLAGWQKERMPEIPDTAYFTLAPDWVCEVLSPSTVTHDRERKMLLYGDNGVPWYWIIDPIAQTLEVYVLAERGRWKSPVVYRSPEQVRVVPFDDVAIDLSVLWGPAQQR